MEHPVPLAALTPLITEATRLGFFSTLQGMAVKALADLPRTATGVAYYPAILEPHTVVKAKHAKALVFEDNTCLLATTSVYPCPFRTSNPTPEAVDRFAQRLAFLPESTPIRHQHSLLWTPNTLVPAWRPMEPPLDNTTTSLLDDLGKSLLWALTPTHPIVAACALVWMSQPIAPNGTLAPPQVKLSVHPSKLVNRYLVPIAEETLNATLASVATWLPPLPGQTLLDGAANRMAVWRTTPPRGASAHDHLTNETLPFLTALRAVMAP